MRGLFHLNGKVALVSGGGSGLGLAISEGLLSHGAKVYIVGRKLEKLQAAAEKLSQFGECHVLQGNLSNDEGSKALAALFAEKEGRLDILVNNAGNTWAATIEDFPDKGWDKVMDLNVRGVFNLTRDLLPQLSLAGSASNPARVINIGSAGAIVTRSMSAYSYVVSKAAVHHLTRVLAREFFESNLHINVNAIAPGRFPSNMTSYLLTDPAAMAAECESIPMGRFGEPKEIAALAVTLSSTAGAYMSGTIIPLDGGGSTMVG
jgi:NAD(P)-dependent dehydrogenase (short-subunit alcohol dehydrogenase family)